MASIGDNKRGTPGEDRRDSGYLEIVGAPYIPPVTINSSSLNTVEKLRNELEKYKKLHDQLRDHIFRMSKNVLLSEKELQKVETTKKGEQVKNDIKIQEARVRMEDLIKRNKELLLKITEYENSIKVLEMNEKELLKKLAAFQYKETNRLLTQSRKTENTTELLGLKQRIQDMTKELEEKDKTIAMSLSEQSKIKEKLEQNTKEVKSVKCMLEESKKTNDKMANTVNDTAAMMKIVLAKVEVIGTNPTEEHEKVNQVPDKKTEAEATRRVQSPKTPRLLDRRPKVPPITPTNRSKGQEKPRWNGVTKNK